MEESFMSYREEHNEILAKKIYEELKQMPDVCRDYVKYLESLERSYNTIYGYMHDLQTFFYFFNSIQSSNKYLQRCYNSDFGFVTSYRYTGIYAFSY